MAVTTISSCRNLKYLVQPLTRICANDENNNFVINTTAKRSLFGSPNIVEIEMLLEEQREIDRERFLDVFGINLDNIEELNSEGLWSNSGCKRVLDRLKLVENSTPSNHRNPLQLHKNPERVIDSCLSKSQSS